jgi:uncharacterized membrane protein YoaK (UPF0700 family)
MGVQLARWVWVGAGALAAVAGMVNAVGFLGFEHQAVTHLTGTTTMLGIAVAAGDTGAVLRLLALTGAFLAGAALAGLVIQDSTLRLGRRYGVALAMESALLFASVPLFQRGAFSGMVLAAAACGLQNAMATTYSGAVVRTSHLSGMFTDLGIGLGHALRGLPLQVRRLRLCAVIIASFAVGAVVGAFGFARFGYAVLYLPATLTGLVGIGYAAYRQWVLASDAPA